MAILVENVLPHLTSLRSLDLGQDTGFGLTNWKITTVLSRLTYLRASLSDVAHLYHVMSNKALATTLEQLHVTMRNMDWGWGYRGFLPEDLELPPMLNLHTFTLVQTILSNNRINWSTIESLTAPDHMPALRRMNLAIFMTVDVLRVIKRSLLFTDDRRIDVQFAFIVDYVSPKVQLSDQVPHGSRCHPRQVVGVTCVSSWLSRKYQHLSDIDCHVRISK